MKKFFLILLIIFLPLYIFLKIMEINVFNKSFYIKSYEKYNVEEISGKNLKELGTITEGIFIYLKDKGDEEVLKPYFNTREIKHMEDVKVLFKKGHTLKYISFILSIITILISIKNREWKMAKGIFYRIFIWWGFIGLLLLFVLIDFNKYFTYFHLIFFRNDLWLLDPNTDLLIQMLPEQFFIFIFSRILLFFFIVLAIIQMSCYIIMRKEEDNSGWINKF